MQTFVKKTMFVHLSTYVYIPWALYKKMELIHHRQILVMVLHFIHVFLRQHEPISLFPAMNKIVGEIVHLSLRVETSQRERTF